MASRKIEDLTPYLQNVFRSFKTWYEATFRGREVFLICTHRSVKEQQEHYAKGRTKPGRIITYSDGIKKKSKHNSLPSNAFDFAIKIDGKVTWVEKHYASAWAFFRKKGLRVRWGGDFSRFKDLPHVEEL